MGFPVLKKRFVLLCCLFLWYNSFVRVWRLKVDREGRLWESWSSKRERGAVYPGIKSESSFLCFVVLIDMVAKNVGWMERGWSERSEEKLTCSQRSQDNLVAGPNPPLQPIHQPNWLPSLPERIVYHGTSELWFLLHDLLYHLSMGNKYSGLLCSTAGCNQAEFFITELSFNLSKSKKTARRTTTTTNPCLHFFFF